MVTERQAFVPKETILEEVRTALGADRKEDIDWITFIGSGETTLHSDLGYLIRKVKALTSIPVAVITNGSFLHLYEVRQDLSNADAVLPSLDAGSQDLYRRINRPHPAFTFKHLIDGLKAFRQDFSGQLWIEVMLVQGMNDTQAALTDLARLLKEIQPDEVHILQPTRPPAETWVQPSDGDGLLRAQAILGQSARVISPAGGSFDLSGDADPVQAILQIISRHPMRESELVEAITQQTHNQPEKILEALSESGQAHRIHRYGIPFWTTKHSRFAPD
jgi:wyosine [tRNA(Phe)-imidazoG37] synthetase (radical SAM superfamily)